jgi:hypothetical protein
MLLHINVTLRATSGGRREIFMIAPRSSPPFSIIEVRWIVDALQAIVIVTILQR